ncbi:phosphoenolpyruvate carboxykinase (ATP) [Mucilaginibacter agri]|uniref:Phosphoenolpyruvate carboxykinase (ATP) n=1 Tax=Mucilaginibacter agri TaxID=2695265 RepID=A0A965ZEL9_9SPHI|nr:phosphoenolpyruvate carboxykinase (ATP) [Mucilaginibacter agri]NCD68271.1 phosphoenolpyruvate carboxykinase (ATP) [Mucilaginibacter agri]
MNIPNFLYPITHLDLCYLGFSKPADCFYQLSPEVLTQYAVEYGEGSLTDQQVLSVDTGKFTGRSPKDRFLVKDETTSELVWWNDVNIPFTKDAFDRLRLQMADYLSRRPFFVRDAAVCADPAYRLSLRIITETAYQSLFAYNLFMEPDQEIRPVPEWTIIAAPGFRADPEEDHTRQANFSIIDFSQKMILIGGTGYTGEIKKAVFSVLNFLLPQVGVLPMHCAANVGKDGNSAIFFGLSGTGKTTLSADPERKLIGDDEHGWSEEALFNFEGGCYAKTVNLSAEHEPQIFAAIRPGALLENVRCYPQTRTVNFNDISVTENTRVSYPTQFIANAVQPSIGRPPKHIFFLTADAFGVLPPVSRLSNAQARYYFLSGYTAKIAGTEFGINEPQATFSACFGKAFIPLHPTCYAELLEERIEKGGVQVWLINTGWTGGPYGTGERISLCFTRAIINAVMNGQLNQVSYNTLPLFNLMFPNHCPGVPDQLLNPAENWDDRDAYRFQASKLLRLFKANAKLNSGSHAELPI